MTSTISQPLVVYSHRGAPEPVGINHIILPPVIQLVLHKSGGYHFYQLLQLILLLPYVYNQWVQNPC